MAQKQEINYCNNDISAIHAPKGERHPPAPRTKNNNKVLQKAQQGRSTKNTLLFLIFCPGILNMELNIIFSSKLFLLVILPQENPEFQMGF